VLGGHSYYVKETKGFSLDRVFAHTSILFFTAVKKQEDYIDFTRLQPAFVPRL